MTNKDTPVSHCGYNGKILHVDLSSGTLREEQVPEVIFRRYLGGSRPLCTTSSSICTPGVDPLGPDDVLVFAASVVTGTPALGFSRFTVAAKSPLTNGFGEAEAGGWWGPELKFSGFDAVVIRGKAERPVYLWIHEGEAELRERLHLWGRFAKESRRRSGGSWGTRRFASRSSAPAARSWCAFACISNELRHFNGRCGIGASWVRRT